MMQDADTDRKVAPKSAAAYVVAARQEEEERSKVKKKRVQRACESCRKRKVRCSGLQPGEAACNTCAVHGYECLFPDTPRRRPYPRAYADALEARMMRMEELLAQLAPGVDFTDRIGYMPLESGEEDVKPSSAHAPQPRMKTKASWSSPLQSSISPRSLPNTSGSSFRVGATSSEEEESEDEDIGFVFTNTARPGFQSQNYVNGAPDPATEEGSIAQGQYLGKSASSFDLLDRLKQLSAGDQGHSASSNLPNSKGVSLQTYLPHEIQRMPPAQIEIDSIELYWPAPDLEELLLAAYFARFHNDYPVVNEVIFRRQIRLPEAREQHDFAGLCFIIFAIASRYVADPRVLPSASQLNGAEEGVPQHSPGSHWFRVGERLCMRMCLGPQSIRQTQSLILFIIYMFDSPSSTAPWALVAIAARSLQGAGAHRKVTSAALKRSVVTEATIARMWWTLYSLDKDLSMGHGRPVCIQDEDFDVEEPPAIDDDALVLASEMGVKPRQPSNKPCKFEGFVTTLRLDQINGRTLRTIYAINKAKFIQGFYGRHWDQLIVNEIDSALNKWTETIPTHLRYNANEPNDECFIQAALLHTKYYSSQILVHRTFIPGASKLKAPLNFPSLTICVSAAHATSQILRDLSARGLLAHGGIQLCLRALSAGCILLVSICYAKKLGRHVDEKAVANAASCLEVLKQLSDVWTVAVRFADHFTRLLETSGISSANDQRHLFTERTSNAHLRASAGSYAKALPLTTTELIQASSPRAESPNSAPAGGDVQHAQQHSSVQPSFTSTSDVAFQQALDASMSMMQSWTGADFAAAIPPLEDSSRPGMGSVATSYVRGAGGPSSTQATQPSSFNISQNESYTAAMNWRPPRS